MLQPWASAWRFGLSEEMDNIQDTSGDDMIGGVVGGANPTLQTFDTVSGGSGYDTPPALTDEARSIQARSVR